MSDYSSGQITFSGLASGTDFTSIISKLVEVEGKHKKQMQSWGQEWTDKNEALEALNSSMSTLRTTLLTMNTMKSFAAMNVDSTESTIVTATATASAEQTTHSIEVQQLAKNSIWMSDAGVTDASASLGTEESFWYTYNNPDSGKGPQLVEVKLPAGGSLNDLSTMINDDPNNPGVKATIINDGSSNYLQLRGLDLGSNASLTINTPIYGFLGTFNQTQANQDAHIKVDGWPADQNAWVRSSSNTIDSAIPGVTLSLKDVGKSQITANADTDTMKTNIEDFVTAFNEVLTQFQTATKVDTNAVDTTDSKTTGSKGSILTGNYGVQLVASNLKTVTSSTAVGFNYYDNQKKTGDFYTALSQVGIKTDSDEGSETYGMLSIDDDILDAALASNAMAVAMLFAADNVGAVTNSGDSANFSFSSYIKGLTKAGAYDVSYTIGGDGSIESATIGGETCSIDNSSGIITCNAGSAKGIAIKVNNRSMGTFTGKVQLKEGKIGQIADMLKDYTNDTTGPLNVIINNYEDIIANINKKIDYETDRLDRMKTQLTQQFARLEKTLSEYQSVQTSLTSAISQLTSSS